jgi:hypothetical protein
MMHVNSEELREGAIDDFESLLEGADGATKLREALEKLQTAESSLRRDLVRGMTKAEAEKHKIMLEAITQGRSLLKAVWDDILSKK